MGAITVVLTVLPLLGIAVTIGASYYIQNRLQDLGVDPVPVSLPPLPVWPTNNGDAIDEDDGDNSIVSKTKGWKYHNMTGKIEVIGGSQEIQHGQVGGLLVGPESLVVSSKPREGGGDSIQYLFMSLGDGRIARISESQISQAQGQQNPWTYLTRTGSYDTNSTHCDGVFSPSDIEDMEWACGRTLGMIIVKRSTVDPNYIQPSSENDNKEDDSDEDVLLLADGYRGLLMVTNIFDETPPKDLKPVTLAIGAEEDPHDYVFRLLNGIVQDPADGSIYITETSTQFSRRRIFNAVFDGRPAGRLLRYTKERGGSVRVVADALYMPNGITLNHAKNELLFVSGVTIQRYSLDKKEMIQSDQAFANVLPGTGDNIRSMQRTPTGRQVDCYWVGLGSKFTKPFSLLKFTSERPWLKAILVALVPYRVIVDMIPLLSALAIYDTDGHLIELYQDESATYPWISEGEIFGDYLYLGSWHNTGLARLRI